jgi:hypothetical protein
MTLSDLMAAVRQRADTEAAGYTPALTGSDFFVTEPELISYINQSYFELYDLLISAYGNNYYVKDPPQSITTDGVNSQFALASDFYKLLGVDLVVSSGTPGASVTLKQFEFADRNHYNLPNSQSFYGRTNLRYRLNGDKLWLTPMPSSGQTVKVWYVPRMATLSALSSTVDGVSGWTEYIIVDAAMKCLAKEESDVSVLMAAKQALMVRIQAMADGRNASEPPKVSDVMGFNGGGWPSGDWPGYY